MFRSVQKKTSFLTERFLFIFCIVKYNWVITYTVNGKAADCHSRTNRLWHLSTVTNCVCHFWNPIQLKMFLQHNRNGFTTFYFKKFAFSWRKYNKRRISILVSWKLLESLRKLFSSKGIFSAYHRTVWDGRDLKDHFTLSNLSTLVKDTFH